MFFLRNIASIGLIFLFSCTSIFSQSKQLVISNNGVGSITQSSTIEDVIKIFGNNYLKKSYPGEADTIITLTYTQDGIKFDFDSAENKFNEIRFTTPCNFTTDKGIILQTSTYADVLKQYGNADNTISSGKYYGVRYENILFFFNKIPNVNFTNSPEPYLTSIITRIDVRKPPLKIVE